jgi:hypothetical protein
MAANKGGGDSKQGLIITLVIFVLLSIILSVVAYYGYADQQKLMDDKKAAEGKEATMKKDRDAQQYQKALLRTLVGIPDKGDGETLSGLGSQMQAERAAIVNSDKLKGLGIGWDEATNKPNRSLVDEMARLGSELRSTQLKGEKTEQALKKARDDFEAERTADQAALKKANEGQRIAQAELVTEREKKSQAFLDAAERLAKQDAAMEESNKKLQNTTEDKDKEIRRLKADIARLETHVKRLQDRLPQLNILDYDVAKGKILRLNPAGNEAYINVGSADNAKPGLTFSVFEATAGKPGKNRKGSVEIASVLGEHLSKARITDVQDPTRQPILAGDLLYNPAWSPALREHVAITGLIDLTGDGRDHTAEFVRQLEKQGIVVDAYLDLRDLTVKGKGINWDTNYLVRGQMPELSASQQIKAGDARVEQQQQVMAKVSEMQEEAAKYGVTVVPLRRFLSLIGYKVPRSLPSGALDFQFRPTVTTEGKEPARKEDKGAEKEDKGK